MPTELLLSDTVIENKIYTIRGQKVMLDRDLATLYDVETRILNQAVKRNEKRFPPDFMFQLTKIELEDWKSQNVISNSNQLNMGLRKLPYVFTEHGVAMLSGVLKSEKAIEVNIQIIRIFNRIREALLSNREILLQLEQLDKKVLNLGFDIRMHDGEIETIFELIREIIAEKQNPPVPKNPIGFKITKKYAGKTVSFITSAFSGALPFLRPQCPHKRRKHSPLFLLWNHLLKRSQKAPFHLQGPSYLRNGRFRLFRNLPGKDW